MEILQVLIRETEIPPKPTLSVDMAEYRTMQKLMVKVQDEARAIKQLMHGELPKLEKQLAASEAGLGAALRAALERAFLLTFTPGKQGWQLTLVPRQAPLDRIFRQLALSGRQGVEQLRIQDRQGDETLLDFTDCRYQPEELTDVERHRFAR